MTTAEKLTAIAENQEKVYEAGQKSEYDRFWDTYQQNGNRKVYLLAFAGDGWANESFKPKYDIRVEGNAQQMFTNCLFHGDLAQHLADLGVVLDTSKATVVTSMFYSAQHITRVGRIDVTGVTSAPSVFEACFALATIDTFVVKEQNIFSHTFGRCNKLANLTIEGTIGNDINLSTCPLTRASILSVLEHLSDATTNKILTLKKTAVEAAFAAAEWDALAATKSNWRIDLV